MENINVKKVPFLIKELYKIVDELELNFPGRHFTLDGHLVGSIGEVLASYYYDLELLPSSAVTHDAISKKGSLIQIKATQINRIAISSQPDFLLALKILEDGSIQEIYNGPGEIAWLNTGPLQKNGQKSISLSKLKELMKNVDDDLKIKRVN